jgi:Arc/MetJ-type ribon-helix-helix transcriptional regulator
MTCHTLRDIVLTPDLTAYVDERVAAGQGQSANQVVRAALRFQRHEGQVDRTSQNFLRGLDERLRGLTDPRHAMHEAAAMLGAHLEADRVGFAWIADDDEHYSVEAEWTVPDMPSRVGRRP